MGWFDFCLCGDLKPSYRDWDPHPAREDYIVGRRLGFGAFADIVLAQEKTTGKHFALKVIFLNNPSLNNKPATKALLLQEAKLLRLVDHPHVVKCTRVIEGGDAQVLVLELLKGGNVLDRLYSLSHRYSERDAAAVFGQLAAGVGYLHSQNIIHRDIKPENVMYAETPEPGKSCPTVKLVDLGLAHIYNPDVDETGVLGSAGFVAPEVIRGGVHTFAMDVYSLGVLLFIMLVGRKPFNNTENENLRYCFFKLQEAPGLQDPRWLDLSPDAKDLIMGMLTFNPERRLTAKQILNHEWLLSGGGLTHRPLGQDVALAAAAVADLRRLRNLAGAAVALKRVTSTGSKVYGNNDHTDEHNEYLEQRKQLNKEGDASVGGMKSAAKKVASYSLGIIHDASRSRRSGSNSMGLRRSATAVMLSDLVADTSVHRQAKIDRSVKAASSMGMLAASVVHLIDTSVRKGNGYQYVPSVESSLHGGSNFGNNTANGSTVI